MWPTSVTYFWSRFERPLIFASLSSFCRTHAISMSSAWTTSPEVLECFDSNVVWMQTSRAQRGWSNMRIGQFCFFSQLSTFLWHCCGETPSHPKSTHLYARTNIYNIDSRVRTNRQTLQSPKHKHILREARARQLRRELNRSIFSTHSLFIAQQGKPPSGDLPPGREQVTHKCNRAFTPVLSSLRACVY